MGMNSEIQHVKNATTARGALDAMIAEDTAEYGYSHSWRSYDLRELSGPLFHALAVEAVQARMDAPGRDETAYAVEVYHPDDVETRTVEVAGTIDGAVWNQGWAARNAAMGALAAEKVRLRAGEVITNVGIAQRDVQVPGHHYPQRQAQMTETVKVLAEAPKEATQTRYFAVTEHTQMKDLAWDKGHPSQAAARSAAVNALEAGRASQFDVIGITRRVSGAPLVRTQRSVTKAAVTLSVTVSKAKTKTTKHGGYIVGGWYHS